MALRTVHVTIRGTRPLLFNKFGRDAIPVDPTANERTGVAGNDPEEWRTRLMADKEGHLYIRPDYVFSNLCYRAGWQSQGQPQIGPLCRRRNLAGAGHRGLP